MQKHTWHKVAINKQHKEPSHRWGHCSTVRQQQIIYFGGYADSIYMNDVWAFNTKTMAWKEHKTCGDVPSLRSNCTVHYDQESDSVILFGGGGNNKRRFNTVSILHWSTKIWTELSYGSEDVVPWERTYHSSVMKNQLLVMFGGQGIADLDDLWVFDLRTKQWKEIMVDQKKAKPNGRRFHTSVLIENDFYVIAGCHGKYRSMGDIWKIDLSQLFENGKTEGFEWVEVKMKGSSFLTRWGHTSVVFQKKIYVFGGRFCNDLQDLIIIDPEGDSLRTMRVGGVIPKARRRHSSAFVGGCMVIFGGFNGEYFSDLAYINVFDARPRQLKTDNIDREMTKWVGKSTLSDGHIKSTNGKSIPVHKGLMTMRFNNQAALQQFLEDINGKYTEEELGQILQTLYIGAGNLPENFVNIYNIDIFETVTQKSNTMRGLIDPMRNQIISLVGRGKNQVYYLPQEKYMAYLQKFHQSQHYDVLFALGQDCIPVNKTLLAISSQYFESLLKEVKGDTVDFNCYEQFGDARVFQVLFGYLQSGYLVVPEEVNANCWMLLCQIADYMCLSSLKGLCENEMLQLLTDENCEELLSYGAQNGLKYLSMSSAEVLVCCMLEKNQKHILELLYDKSERNSSENAIVKYLDVAHFDLKQREKREDGVFSEAEKQRSENNIEKENESEPIL